MPTLSDCHLEETQWAGKFREGAFKPLTSTVFYNCPKCKKFESSQRGVFQRVDLVFKHRCGFCHKVTAVKSWTCQCGPHWHTCEEHRGGYLLMPVGEPITAKLLNGLPSTFTLPRESRISKRKVGTDTGGINAQHKRCRRIVAKGVKRKPNIHLSDSQRLLKRPACLGPVFCGVSGGTSTSSSLPA